MSCNSDDDNNTTNPITSQLEDNIALAIASANNNFNEKNTKNVTTYINENKYLQHSINGQDGVGALINLINFFNESIPTFQVQNIRAFAESDLVITQNEESIEGNAVDVSLDLYRIEDNKIVEHWDAIQDYTDTPPLNNNGIVDGTSVNPSSTLDKEIMRNIAQEYFNR